MAEPSVLSRGSGLIGDQFGAGRLSVISIGESGFERGPIEIVRIGGCLHCYVIVLLHLESRS